ESREQPVITVRPRRPRDAECGNDSSQLPSTIPDQEVMMRRNHRVLGALALLCPLQAALAADPPAAAIATKMATVTDELNRTVTGKPVQDQQKVIVRDLDELIASLEKQCEACKGGMKRNNPNRGMDDSMIGRGTGGIGTLVNPGESGKDWSKLSDRERDRIIQS